MSDERLFFTPTAEPNGTGVSGLLAEAKASEVKYKDRCKMHVLASPEVGWTPRRIGRYLKRHPRTVQRILGNLRRLRRADAALLALFLRLTS